MPDVYSFKDTVGCFIPGTGLPFVINGTITTGFKKITIEMATERGVIDTAADGNQCVSYIPGDNGTVTIECQQTSSIHQYLLAWFNSIITAANLGDMSNFATASMQLANILDGSAHSIKGIFPNKTPPKTYTTQQTDVTWVLMAAEIINL